MAVITLPHAHTIRTGLESSILFILRLGLAWVFFKSGWLKWQSWEVTLQLFAYEYDVPLLPTTLAALLATTAELLLPPLLALGLWVRPVALALLVLNTIAALSYPDISMAGLKDHQLWGLGLLWLSLAGGGHLSLDYWRLRR